MHPSTWRNKMSLNEWLSDAYVPPLSIHLTLYAVYNDFFFSGHVRFISHSLKRMFNWCISHVFFYFLFFNGQFALGLLWDSLDEIEGRGDSFLPPGHRGCCLVRCFWLVLSSMKMWVWVRSAATSSEQSEVRSISHPPLPKPRNHETSTW